MADDNLFLKCNLKVYKKEQEDHLTWLYSKQDGNIGT